MARSYVTNLRKGRIVDIFWLRDKSLEGAEDLQPPDVIAAEIAENLEAALEQFAEIHEDLRLSTSE